MPDSAIAHARPSKEASPSGGSRPFWLLSLLGGLLVGILTNVLQGVLPDALQQLANSGAVWISAAFAAGAVAGGPSWRVGRVMTAVAGALTQVGAVAGYYAYAEWGPDRAGAGSLAPQLAWLALGVVAGPLLGLAGSWWRSGRQVPHVIGSAALGGVFLMEGLYYAWTLHYYGTAAAFLTLGVLLPLGLGRTARARLTSLGAAVAFALPMVGAFHLFGSLSGLG